MHYNRERLMARRTPMIVRGDWRDVTLLDHLTHAVAKTPDKIAIVAIRSDGPATGHETETRITYRELDRLSDQVAGNLRARGVVPGDTVSFQLPNWWEFTVLHLACLKAGAVSNPLMVIFRERELSFMLALAETKVLVVPARFRGFDYPAMVARVRDRLPALRHVFVAAAAGLVGSGRNHSMRCCNRRLTGPRSVSAPTTLSSFCTPAELPVSRRASCTRPTPCSRISFRSPSGWAWIRKTSSTCRRRWRISLVSCTD
jgi:non-ribosomal peptide synthetase component E (peptide arylation enzyme)